MHSISAHVAKACLVYCSWLLWWAGESLWREERVRVRSWSFVFAFTFWVWRFGLKWTQISNGTKSRLQWSSDLLPNRIYVPQLHRRICSPFPTHQKSALWPHSMYIPQKAKIQLQPYTKTPAPISAWPKERRAEHGERTGLRTHVEEKPLVVITLLAIVLFWPFRETP